MGYEIQIKCPECDEIQSIEAKEVSFNGDLVSFDFECDCGFKTCYRNLETAQFESMLHSQSITEWWAQWSGLPEEQLKEYEYPPDVMKEVDLERRKIRGLELKEMLKSSRISYPSKTSDGWWRVYSLLGVQVEFDRATRSYRIRSGTAVEFCKDVNEFATAIQKYA